jgi:hypothetical protein
MREAEKVNLERYVRSVFRDRAGEVVQSRDGRKYQVQPDGSLRRIHGEERVVAREGGMS